MTTSEIVTMAISSLIALASAFWALFQHAQRNRDAHLDERHRAAMDALGAQPAAAEDTFSSRRDLWRKVGELDAGMTAVKVDLARLGATLVTRDYLTDALDRFEKRQDERMDALSRRIGALNGHAK